MLHMYGIIPYMFDCWADPVVHLLLLKSSMDWVLEHESHHSRELVDLRLYSPSQ